MNFSHALYKIMIRVLLILFITTPFSIAEDILESGIYVIDQHPSTDETDPYNYYAYTSKYLKVPQIMHDIKYAIVSKNLNDKGRCEDDFCHNKVFFTTLNIPLTHQLDKLVDAIKTTNKIPCTSTLIADCITSYYKDVSLGLVDQQSFCQSYENLPSPDSPFVSKLNKAFCFGLKYKTKDTFTIFSRDKKVDFTLRQPQPYQTTLYTRNSIPLYTTPNLSAPKQTIEKQSHLAIIKQLPDWYEIDYYSADKGKQHGWVNRDDFIAGEWIPQEAKTKQYKFEAALYNEGQNDYDGMNEYSVMIRVINRSNNSIIQTLRNFPSDRTPYEDYNDTKKNIVELIDVNFDGHLDMVTHAPEMATGIHGSIGVFLYQARKQRFIESNTLAWVDELNIDKKLKTVDIVNWSGKTDRFEYKYRFINHKQVLIYSSETEGFLDSSETRIGRLINGKMHYTTTRDNYNNDQNE